MKITELGNRFEYFCVKHNLNCASIKEDRGISWMFENDPQKLNFTMLKNKLLLSSMKIITKTLNQVNIQFVFLKGLIEAYDLYPKYCLRPCDDIDILVHKEDIVHVCLVLAELGFTYERGIKITEETLVERKSNAISHHFAPFVKKTKYGIDIIVEVHYCLDEQWNYTFDDFTKELISRKENIEIDGGVFPALSKQDRFIFSMFHCGRDIFFVYENIGFSNKSKYKLKSLIDAILLRCKYDSIYEDLNSRINKYGFAPCIRFINEFCYQIFGIRLLKNLNVAPSNDAFKEELCCRLLSTEPHSVLLSEKYFVNSVFVSITEFLIKKNPCFLCSNEFKVIQNNDLLKIKKQDAGFITIEKNDYAANIYLKYDENRLFFVFDVKDPIIKVRGLNKKNKWGESINILFYNPEFELGEEKCLKGVFVEPYCSASGNINVISSYIGRWDDFLNGSEFQVDENYTDFRFTNDGYILKTAIYWSSLGINPQKVKYIGLDFVINNVDTNDCEIEFSYIWSKKGWQLYKPYNYNRLILDSICRNQTL